MTERPRAADDFETIRSRLVELRRSRDPVLLSETVSGSDLDALFAAIVDNSRRYDGEGDASYRARMIEWIKGKAALDEAATE